MFEINHTPPAYESKKGVLRLIPLGGIGNVTKNMYIYEYRENPETISDILIVDCGVGFPDENMYGIDLLIPDISYLRDKKDKIRGLALTHGHEDHIGALPYILPEIRVPVYATLLTSKLCEVKLKEFGLQNQVNSVKDGDVINIGPFKIKYIHVTHSVPDSANLFIKTPVGNFYHGSDFKFDWTPIDGKRTDVGSIAGASKEGIMCLFSDCVRVESEGYTLSETVIEDTLEKEIRNCFGKFIFTTQSSNISRIQQAIDVSVRNNRKIAFLGRSIVKNVEVAAKLAYLKFADMNVIEDKDIAKYNPKEVTIIVTGSQAQPNSALMRMAYGSHKFARIKPDDVVVFSADPIPGYENAVHTLIDILSESGARVAYSEITDSLHVSGHGAKNDLALMIGLTNPLLLMPIGGTFRQMKHYADLAMEMGYKRNQIILPLLGEIIEFDHQGKYRISQKINLKNVMIDGLGVGDIGNVVLRDRQTMASEGIVVVVVPIDQSSGKVIGQPDIISRGFIYMKESGELIDKAKKIVISVLKLKKGRIIDWQYVRKQIEKNLEEFLFKKTHRRPLILAVVIHV